jgi:hypothetical protein
MQAVLGFPEEGVKYFRLELTHGVREEVVAVGAADPVVAGGQHKRGDYLLVLRVGLGGLEFKSQRTVLLVDLVAVDRDWDLTAADHASAMGEEPVETSDREHEGTISWSPDFVVFG